MNRRPPLALSDRARFVLAAVVVSQGCKWSDLERITGLSSALLGSTLVHLDSRGLITKSGSVIRPCAVGVRLVGGRQSALRILAVKAS